MTVVTRILALAALLALGACGGGGGGGGSGTPVPGPANFLSVADVEKVIAQAVAEAQAQKAQGTIAVVDRVGNVLGVFRMNGATGFKISSGTGVQGGLEGYNIFNPGLGAISMAITGAYLSSSGNGFTTRTASQIIQQHFNPEENKQPGGPLFGVQYSQLTCSDLIRHPSDGTVGPKPAPLGLAAEPGGLPLYKNGVVVGGIGIMATGLYSLDLDVLDVDTNVNEVIAGAGSRGFETPTDRRADRITADGRTFRFTDNPATASNPANVPPFSAIDGTVGKLLPVDGYYAGTAILAGVEYGTPASGMRPDTNAAFAGLNAWVLVDQANVNRYPPRGGTDGLLTQADVTQILRGAIDVANRARAQIRQPGGSPAEVTMTVVDTRGAVLGLIRTPDAPVFGIDVSLQKARTAALFSSRDAGAVLDSLPPAVYPFKPSVSIAAYATAMRRFLGDPTALANGVAYSNRAVGNLARPFFPDGITGTANGPFSVPSADWSIFNVGLQLDLVANAVFASLLGGTAPPNCTSSTRIANGIQIFPGAVPIYRGTLLVGAIGISGDGVDQDDMIAFLGLANGGKTLNNGIANAPATDRADNIVPQGEGTRLRYVNCPQAPFNNSSDQNVCAGL